jgi:hypothetical protein
MSDTPAIATREKESPDSISAAKEILLGNQRIFARESPFLDALLVFVSP